MLIGGRYRFGAQLKPGDVTSLVQGDPNRSEFAAGGVVFCEALSKFASLNPDDGIFSRIEGGRPVKNLES
jgi:hypothetical protein